ncbi:hypothetical protein CDEF62S_02028 [Castellaniella defragrans]
MNAIDLYRWMLTSRQFESALGAKNPRWFSTEGEEATFIGSSVDDSLERGDIIAETMTGTVNLEVESPHAGTIKALLADVDDTVAVHQPIAVIERADALNTAR